MAQVGYDHRAITIDGRRTLILGGSIHYPRSTPAMWPELMKRSRDVGLNTIETYVFWNLHERKRGVFDFSDRLDLLRFLGIAQGLGLHVILRIGPYICAETNYGGLPPWLRDAPGIRMRTCNELFMREMERWVRLLCEYARPMFAPNGGPIILAQIENEYANIARHYGDDGQRYLRWCVELAGALNVGVPWVMCCGAPPGVIETINAFYGHVRLDAHFRAHPDQPPLVTENWGGWYDTWGHPHHRRSPEDTAYGTARFFAAGGAGNNYYMWHGGTNFGRESMYLQPPSYDFDAPLDEFGLLTTKARHLGRLHRILNDNADLLLAGERPEPEKLGAKQSAFVWSGGRSLVFLCNDDAQPAAVAFRGVTRELPAKSVLIFSNDKLLMNTAEVAADCVVVRRMMPARPRLGPMTWRQEPLPADRPAEIMPSVKSDRPVEQLLLTRDDSDYCWYTAAMAGGKGTLTLEGVGDVVHVFVDGRLVATSRTPLPELRGRLDGEGFRQSFEIALPAGRHELSILCCAIGLVKLDEMLGDANMAEERKGLWGRALWKGKVIPGPWTMQPFLVGERLMLFAEGGSLALWAARKPNAKSRPLRWWRTTFRLSARAQAVPLALDLVGMTKGLAWLNGRCIGRYWLVAATGASFKWYQPQVTDDRVGEPTQRFYHLPADWLAERNTLVLFDELGGDPSRVRLCKWAEVGK